MLQNKTETKANLTWKKKFIFSIITLALIFLILEMCLRVYSVFFVGPSALLYGTPFARQQIQGAPASTQNLKTEPEAKTYMKRMTHDEWVNMRNVEIHPNESQGYTKYFPYQIRVDLDLETGQRFNVTINKDGFRGRDFTKNKEPGVIRILCLGASSTFGYFDRDDETYPVYLEQILNERYAGKVKFEVINFGIPHLYSPEIYNLFVAEGIQLHPDIVTYYEGSNDSDPPQRWLNQSLANAAVKKIARVLLVAKFIDSITGKYFKQSLSEKEISDISNYFIQNVNKIYQECRKRDILFIVANQQKASQAFDRAMLKNLTYQQEVEKIKNKLQNTDALLHPELAILIHSVLMKKLEDWATANKVPFVDVIGRLDHDRNVLVSWVHLSPRGNRMVAQALADKILEFNWGRQSIRSEIQ